MCTIPLGVLKSGVIRFIPALPSAHREAIAKIPMGNVTKAALKFQDTFWPEQVQYFGFTDVEMGRWPYFLNYRTFSNANILLPLSFGNYAATAEAMTNREIEADLMDVLHKMFGTDIPKPDDMIVTRWSQDPETLGAYSYAGVGVIPKDFDSLAEPVAACLVLAGEHTIFDFHGTVHGAYISGNNAAKRVMSLAR